MQEATSDNYHDEPYSASPPGRAVALWLAQLSWGFMREMPEATGDIREIIGQVSFPNLVPPALGA